MPQKLDDGLNNELITLVYDKLEEIFNDRQFQMVMLVRTGSYAYGTVRPESDIDLAAVVIPPVRYLVGTKKWDGHEFTVDDKDVRIYSLSKLVSLLVSNNPNVLELLWLPNECYLQLFPIGSRLLEHRELFLSQRVLYTFGGYAYQLWKKSGLGAKGKAEVEHLGYNPKFVMHNIRLLDMLIELLETGRLSVRREEAEFLLDIRTGKFSKECLEQLSEDLMDKANSLVKTTGLPETPDHAAIDRFLVQEHVSYIDFVTHNSLVDVVANYVRK